MTWEELKEKAIARGYRLECYIKDDNNEKLKEPIEEELPKSFYKDGDVFIDGTRIARKRTPDQMYAIMEALK